MTIYKVATGPVGGGIFRRGKERILGCEPLKPSETPYGLEHAGVYMTFKVFPDDRVDIDLKSLSGSPAILKLSGEAMLGIMALNQAGDNNRYGSEKLGLTPKFREAAVEVGPDRDSVTLKLERHAANIVPTVFGEDKLKKIKPRVKKTTDSLSGGARIG